MIQEFEWDDDKEKININKHNVLFLEAIETFFDPNGFKLLDRSHSDVEPRFYWIGKTKSGKILTTYYTQRKKVIRIIGSAEWRKFRRIYEATKTK